MQRRPPRACNQAALKEEPAENQCHCWACEPTDCGECYVCSDREKYGNQLCRRINSHQERPELCVQVAAASDEINSHRNDSPVSDRQKELKVISVRIKDGQPAGGANVVDLREHTSAVMKLAFPYAIVSRQGIAVTFGVDISDAAIASYYAEQLEDDDSLTGSERETLRVIIREAADAPDLEATLVRCKNEKPWDCPGMCGNQILCRLRAELSRRPPRHRRDACSMLWAVWSLTARSSHQTPRHRRDIA